MDVKEEVVRLPLGTSGSVIIPRHGDVMGECYLDLLLDRHPMDPVALLTRVKYQIGGETLEEYGGDTLRIALSLACKSVRVEEHKGV